MARALIDGLWFFGGNRERGIGAYLDYYFREVCEIPVQDRYWLVPQNAADWQVNKLLGKFGGHSIELDTEMSGQRQRELLDRWVDEKEVISVFVSSPFERPRSLLDFVTLFQSKAMTVEAIVFDLLPLQFRREILETWPEEDQEQYERRLKRLRRVDRLHAISPQTLQAVVSLLDYPEDQIQVLKFGLGTKWLTIPANVAKTQRVATGKVTKVVTISGGEWRKNLEGTLRYFSQEWGGKPAELAVICELGLKHSVKLLLLCVRLGIWRQVKFLGKASESTKWKQLLQADVFLFLSRAEGLGIPLLEAKKAKIPRIVLSSELAEAGFGELVEKFEVSTV